MADHPQWDDYELRAVAAYLADAPPSPDPLYSALYASQRLLEGVVEPDEYLAELLELFPGTLPEWVWLANGEPVASPEKLARAALLWEESAMAKEHPEQVEHIVNRASDTGAWYWADAALVYLLRSRRHAPGETME